MSVESDVEKKLSKHTTDDNNDDYNSQSSVARTTDDNNDDYNSQSSVARTTDDNNDDYNSQSSVARTTDDNNDDYNSQSSVARTTDDNNDDYNSQSSVARTTDDNNDDYNTGSQSSGGVVLAISEITPFVPVAHDVGDISCDNLMYDEPCCDDDSCKCSQHGNLKCRTRENAVGNWNDLSDICSRISRATEDHNKSDITKGQNQMNLCQSSNDWQENTNVDQISSRLDLSSRLDSEKISELFQMVPEVARVNLDITSLISFVSNVCHGGCNYHFREDILTQQATWERERPILPKLMDFIKGQCITCIVKPVVMGLF